jgi:hypothetical protein
MAAIIKNKGYRTFPRLTSDNRLVVLKLVQKPNPLFTKGTRHKQVCMGHCPDADQMQGSLLQISLPRLIRCSIHHVHGVFYPA